MGSIMRGDGVILTRDPGLGTRDSGLGTRDPGLGTRDSGLGTRDSGLGKSAKLPVRKGRKRCKGERKEHPNMDVRSTAARSEEHTSELPSLIRIAYDVFLMQTKKHRNTHTTQTM